MLDLEVQNSCGWVTQTLGVQIQPYPGIETPDLSRSHKGVNLTSVESGDRLTYTLLLKNVSPVAPPPR